MAEFDYVKERKTADTAECTTVIQRRKKAGRPFNPIFEPLTHAGHKISYKQTQFIDNLIELGEISAAAKKSGYTNKAAKALLAKYWVKDEIQYRMDLMESAQIASAEEILRYLTRVMRNQEKDQFGLDVPISERTRAAQELARRIIDIPGKREEEEREKEETQVKLIIQRGSTSDAVIDGEYKDVGSEPLSEAEAEKDQLVREIGELVNAES